MSAWHKEAACSGMAYLLDFFDGTDSARARAVCMGCPVRVACLEDALAREAKQGPAHMFGIYGGLSPIERAAILDARAYAGQAVAS